MDSKSDETPYQCSERTRNTPTAITPLQTTLIGAAILAGGATLSGAAHYSATAKRLAEEGIDRSARLRALPLAAQALGASTVAIAALGAAVLAGWRFLGGDTGKSEAQVSSFSDAIAFAKQQRDIVREQFRGAVAGETRANQGKKVDTSVGAPTDASTVGR